jgi:hypothetical protein
MRFGDPSNTVQQERLIAFKADIETHRAVENEMRARAEMTREREEKLKERAKEGL